MALVALLKFIPRTGSLASHWRLAASWFSPKLLARACCPALPPSLGVTAWRVAHSVEAHCRV